MSAWATSPPLARERGEGRRSEKEREIAKERERLVLDLFLTVAVKHAFIHPFPSCAELPCVDLFISIHPYLYPFVDRFPSFAELSAVTAIMGKIPTPAEYLQYASKLDATAADTYLPKPYQCV